VKWNPYYVAYALAHGHRSVESMVAADRRHRSRCGYRMWIMDRWREWGALRGWSRDSGGQWYEGGRGGRIVCATEADHAHFAGWLHGSARREAEALGWRQLSSRDEVAAAQNAIGQLRCPLGPPSSWVLSDPPRPRQRAARVQLSLALATP